MKQTKILLVEDQPNQYRSIVVKINGYNFPFTGIIDIGPTVDSTYLDYLSKIQSLEQLPTIILIDYDLEWKERSSSANGHELASSILHLYPEGGLPFVIFISGPHPDKIKTIANVFSFIDEGANAISLDKAKFDLPHSKSGYTMLQFAINKAIIYSKRNLNLPSLVTFDGLREYPNLHQIAVNKKFHILEADFNKGEGDIREIELSKLLFIIFKTATHKDYMLIVSKNGERLQKWLKPMSRGNVGFWTNSFRSAGLDFLEMSSIFCNPMHFEYSKNAIRAKDVSVFSMIELDFKSEYALFKSSNLHPFKKQIDSILPPPNLKNRYML